MDELLSGVSRQAVVMTLLRGIASAMDLSDARVWVGNLGLMLVHGARPWCPRLLLCLGPSRCLLWSQAESMAAAHVSAPWAWLFPRFLGPYLHFKATSVGLWAFSKCVAAAGSAEPRSVLFWVRLIREPALSRCRSWGHFPDLDQTQSVALCRFETWAWRV